MRRYKAGSDMIRIRSLPAYVMELPLLYYRFFPFGVGRFAGEGGFFAFFADCFGLGGADGRVTGLPVRGGTARMRHLGPEPMRSSRWALSSASRTR